MEFKNEDEITIDVNEYIKIIDSGKKFKFFDYEDGNIVEINYELRETKKTMSKEEILDLQIKNLNKILPKDFLLKINKEKRSFIIFNKYILVDDSSHFYSSSYTDYLYSLSLINIEKIGNFLKLYFEGKDSYYYNRILNNYSGYNSIIKYLYNEREILL